MTAYPESRHSTRVLRVYGHAAGLDFLGFVPPLGLIGAHEQIPYRSANGGSSMMKYLPLIWAALRRKPIRTGLTFLSVTVAFTLFGLMIGMGATMDLVEKKAHPDRVWTQPRFDMNAMPVTIARQIAKLPGVKNTSVMSFLLGYVGDPKNRNGLLMADDEYGRRPHRRSGTWCAMTAGPSLSAATWRRSTTRKWATSSP
jgi:hypothetical protein